MSETSRAYFAVAVAMVSVSFASIFIKWSESDPFVIAAYRLAFSCAMLLPFMFLTGGFSGIRSFNRREVMLVLLSGLALTFHFGLWIVSLTLTLVSTSVILVTSHPIFVAAVSHFLLKERVKRVAVIGILIAFSGVALISISDYSEGSVTILGDLMAFLGGICAGIYFLSGRVARQSVAVAPYAFSVYGISSVLLFLSGAAAGDQLLVIDSREIILFLLLALLPTMLGHTMFNYALKKVPAHIVSTSVLGEPVGASILAYLLLPGEVPNLWIIAGGALVVGGLYIVLSRGYESGIVAQKPPD
ncbi:MAG: DMT family transporter [Thermoplasmatota archaeon]|nr:DMT family transporter [Candidatus Thermoplasmatota archaeon]MBU1913915.1 DMT family transporter [Candidatus Thermoplasmatota archaeon]